MNDFITLGEKKYTTSEKWEPQVDKAMRVRLTILGELDATYAPAEILTFSGEVRVNVTETRSGYGSQSDLEAILATKGGITFVDHENTTRTAHVKGWKRSSLIRKWDSPSNKFFYEVTLISKR